MNQPSPIDIVQTWRVVEQHRFGRPDSVYSEGVLGEMMRDAVLIIQQFCNTNLEKSDYGQAIRNAADKLESENPGNKFLHLSRRQVVEQMHVIASARRVAAFKPLALGDGKAEAGDNAPTGLIWLESEFPQLWKNWRETDGLLPMPAFWFWQRGMNPENQAMPIIAERVAELLKQPENEAYLEIGRKITANRANEAMKVAAQFHKVPDHMVLRYFFSRSLWDKSACSEIAANVEAYNVGRPVKMKFDPFQAYNDGRNEAIAFIYGKLTLEQ